MRSWVFIVQNLTKKFNWNNPVELKLYYPAMFPLRLDYILSNLYSELYTPKKKAYLLIVDEPYSLLIMKLGCGFPILLT